MKSLHHLLCLGLIHATVIARLSAFDWSGGTMTVPVTCYGSQVFEGYVPSSPWGSKAFTNDPVLELRDSANNLLAQYTLTGAAADWNDGGSRSATVSFTAPAGTYHLNGRTGTRHVLLAGDGWSGYALTFSAISDPVPPNFAPAISWTAAPGSAASGQSYTVSAHGHDNDGNLTQVNIWKNGQPFAFAGGGNGTDGDSGNATSDTGPQTVTFTAQAVDAKGATSPVITQTVAIGAPNHAPTISWNATPGTVASGQSYSVSAHGHDQDGNLTQVNVWKNGQPFAFAGGGTGTDNDSGNPTSDVGPQKVTFTAQAVDATGATSAVISQIVTVNAPLVNHAPTASITGSTSLQVGQTGSWTFSAADEDGNLAAWRFYASSNPNPQWSAASGATAGPGNYSTSFSLPGTYTWVVEAKDSDGLTGSASISVRVSPPDSAPTITWTSVPATVASGQNYTISAHAHDDDGNLTSVRIWKNGQPFATAGGGDGTDADSAGSSSDAGPQTITFTAQAVDSDGATSTMISQTVTISPPNHAPTISWNTTPGTVASGQSYTISAHGHDQDGNLTQVKVWKSSQAFATGGGGNGTDADSAGSSSDAGPQTITFTAQAVDATGATSAVISQTVTVSPPPPTQYTLVTAAGPGGSVSAGGTFVAGSVVTVSAFPEATHDFAGWSGDAAGMGNPVGVTLDRNKSVQANFALKTYVLTTSATAGGSVTPGGSYPAGTTVTISALPDSSHYFVGWTGDASGSAISVAVTLTRSKTAQAVFSGKSAQTITFDSPGNEPMGAAPFALIASASSGLPVAFTVLSGPATITNGMLQVTGPGAVTVQASQPGNSLYLPAPSVTRTFNVTAPVAVKYRGTIRTLLATPHTANGTPLVIQVP